MKKKKVSRFVVMKWITVLAIVFALSVPVSAKVCQAAGAQYKVQVDTGYLALRTAKAYDANNEIGKLYTGDIVEVTDSSDSQYWYVYSRSLGMGGYVNKDYLVASAQTTTSTQKTISNGWYVVVESGYLALRTEKAYDSSNEIGELYSGDTVALIDSSDPDYWYVRSPKLGKSGYVNKDYIVSHDDRYTVSVDSGYLALRTAMAYDSSNEIGELYTGDTVYVKDSTDPDYWYVYSPKLEKSGYVNKDYIYSNNSTTMTVSVATGYLALRTEKAYDERNELGELYTGDVVLLKDTSDSQYWYVYSPKLDKNGYVNKDYLY